MVPTLDDSQRKYLASHTNFSYMRPTLSEARPHPARLMRCTAQRKRDFGRLIIAIRNPVTGLADYCLLSFPPAADAESSSRAASLHKTNGLARAKHTSRSRALLRRLSATLPLLTARYAGCAPVVRLLATPRTRGRGKYVTVHSLRSAEVWTTALRNVDD